METRVVPNEPTTEMCKKGAQVLAGNAAGIGVDWGTAKQIYKAMLAATPSQPAQTSIDEMVDRFLSWRLPNRFSPDNYISFDRERAERMRDDTNGLSWPMGTNLLTADEAKQMLKHVIGPTLSSALKQKFEQPAQTGEETNAEGYPGIVHDFETVREALVSLVAVARRYLPDYDEHPEVQKADDALAQCEQQPMLIGGSVLHSQPNAAGQDTMPDTETNVDAQASNRSNVIVGNERPSRGRSLTTPAPAAPDGDTPMTDAAAHGFVQMNPQKTDIDMWGIECVDADFARQLERRLREMTPSEEIVAIARDFVNHTCGEGNARSICAIVSRELLRIAALAKGESK
jgi:hypothetical protein